MKNVLIWFLLVLAIACENTTYGEQLSEPARVVDLPFVPKGHGSGSGCCAMPRQTVRQLPGLVATGAVA